MTPKQRPKIKFLDRIAEDSGLAVVVLDESGGEVSASNNNSICRVLFPSNEFGPRCAEFCGKAFEWTAKAGESVDYECHAGLSCRAVPVRDASGDFVAIIGRAFIKAENYRNATNKAINGEWKQFRPTEFFENVLLTGSSENIKTAAGKLDGYRRSEPADILELDGRAHDTVNILEAEQTEIEPPIREISELIERFNREAGQEQALSPEFADHRADIAEWRSLFGSLMTMEYGPACAAILEFVGERYRLNSLMWLERKEGRLVPVTSRGSLRDVPIKIGVPANDERFLNAAIRETPVVFQERRKDNRSSRRLGLFPVLVGGEMRAALAVEGRSPEPADVRAVSRFCRSVGSQIEILRLRAEVSKRDWLAQAVRRFNESLKKIDTDDFWSHVTQISAELLQAERASLLIPGSKPENLLAKAAIGARVNLFTEQAVGSRVSKLVLEEGTPVVVSDIHNVAMSPAPSEWKYKTSSFISYPITIGDRKIAVLNFTDKAGGDTFSERDLELLQAIAPQIAVAIDRTALKDKAGEFEQLSVTDALTGLSNRRYIEKRLAEEIDRSKRHRFPMSLIMLDVDQFKSYNDSFGHPAGDVALKVVSEVLKDTLRSEDVAARYGGEEFAILLPQTTSAEAAAIAERIRRQIERTEFPKRQVTVSIGIAACSAEIETAGDIINAADTALYEAKNQGRNNVRIYDGIGESINDKIH